MDGLLIVNVQLYFDGRLCYLDASTMERVKKYENAKGRDENSRM